MKYITGLIVGIIVLFLIVAMYSALIIAGRSDDQAEKENSEGDDDMFLKKQICPRCKTGKYTYDLDPKSVTCPYIGCWKCNKCHFYKPLEKISKEDKNEVAKKQQEYHVLKNNFLERFFCRIKNG